MKLTLSALAAATLLGACAPGQPGGFIDSDVERGLVGAAVGYGAAKAVGGEGDRGAIAGGVAGIFCDDAGLCPRGY